VEKTAFQNDWSPFCISISSLFTAEAPAVAKAMAGQAENAELGLFLPDREIRRRQGSPRRYTGQDGGTSADRPK